MWVTTAWIILWARNIYAAEYQIFLKDENGCTVRESPDDLFNTFLKLSRSLSESDWKWPIQICSEYYKALTEDLSNIIDSKNFCMPYLIALDTK